MFLNSIYITHLFQYLIKFYYCKLTFKFYYTELIILSEFGAKIKKSLITSQLANEATIFKYYLLIHFYLQFLIF